LTREIDIPRYAIETLLAYVEQHVDILNNEEPFYMNVNHELRELAFGKFLDTSVIETAYIYAHTQPIPLHVDRYKKNSVYNLCVPLYKGDSDQYLLVFDQTFDKYGLSWRLADVDHIKHKPAGPEHKQTSNNDNDHLPSEVLTGIRPCDTDGVVGLTGQAVPDHINKILPYGNDNFYFGLSGTVWNWKPGKALIFKSSQIHGTAMQSEFKIGCVVLMNADNVQLPQ